MCQGVRRYFIQLHELVIPLLHPSLPPQFTDDQLQYSRLDFLKLSDIESVLKLERAGYAFAERMDETGGLDYHLESVRKGPVRRLVEFPVRQVARVFA